MSFGIDAQAIKNKNTIALLFLGVMVLSILPIEITSPVLILLIGLTAAMFITLLFAHEDFVFLFNYFLIAFGIRVFVSYLLYITSFLVNGVYIRGFLFQNDGICYSQQGWQICKLAERGIKITMENFMTNPNLMHAHESGNITPYDFFTSHIYSITGHSPLSLFFMNSAAGALSGIFIYLLAKEIFSRKTAKVVSLFVFFWPSFILWSTQHLKEPLILMLAGVTLWTALYAYRHVSTGFGILATIAALLFFQISPIFAVIAMGAILSGFAFVFFHHLLKNKSVALLTIIIGVIFVLFMFKDKIFEIALNQVGYEVASSGKISIFEFLNFQRSVRSYGNLQFMKGFNISNPITAVIFAPIGLIYAIFAPFPWQIGSLAQIMAIPETIILYTFIPATLRGVIFAYKRRFWPAILLILIILAILGFLALIEGNSGTLFRHRAPAFYLLFIFTACGISLKKNGN